MKKILIVTAIYGRHDLTQIILKYYSNFANASSDSVHLLAVGSEGIDSSTLAFRNGWDYVEAKNTPLSQKFNALFAETEKYDFDFVILVGSDDLVSPELFSYYSEKITRKTEQVFGLKDIFFYSIQKDELLLFSGYPPPSPKTIGAGRCFSRKVLEAINFRPWQHEIINRGLDTSCTAQFRKIGIGEVSVSMKDMGCVAVDIKHPMVTLTKFDQLHNYSRVIESKDILDNSFPCMTEIRKLRVDFTYEDGKDYDVIITGKDHPMYGKKITVCGEVAIDLAIKKQIELP